MRFLTVSVSKSICALSSVNFMIMKSIIRIFFGGGGFQATIHFTRFCLRAHSVSVKVSVSVSMTLNAMWLASR